MAIVEKLGATGITRFGAVPAYYQIETHIKLAIENGTLKPGEELPSEQELAETFKVNRLTVRRAMQELVSKGFVFRSQGRRSRVAMQKIPLDPFGSYAVQVASHGFTSLTLVHKCSFVFPAGRIRKVFSSGERQRLLHIIRVRTLDSIPVALEDNYLHREFSAPFIQDPSRAENLYDSLREHCHLKVWDVDADAEICAADSIEAARLEVREGHPLFALYLTLKQEGKPFGFTFVRFLADRFHFRLGLQPYPVNR